MAFADRLLPASFRGVPFGVREISDESGRRVALHEYPGRSTPFAEDLGRAPRRNTVQGFLVGDDVLQQAQRLREAFETSGPGRLVHPWIGTLEVTVERLRTRWNREHRTCEIEFEVIEAGEQIFPASIPDAASSAAKVADATKASSILAFLSGIYDDALDVADFVRGGLDTGIGYAVTALRALTVAKRTDPAGEFIGGVELLGRLAGGFALGSSDPDEFTLVLRRTVEAAPAARGGGVDGLRALEQLAATPLPEVTALSTQGKRADENARAVVALLRELSLAELVRAAAARRWDSYEEAVAWRARILALLEAQLDAAGDDAFEALRALIAELLSSVPPAYEELPQLVEVTPTRTTAAAVIAYEIFGSAEQADAIAQRNRVRHPAFVPGGAPIAVLIPVNA